MKTINKTTILIAVISLAVGLLAGWSFFRGHRVNLHDEHSHINTEDAGHIIWTCSMHPQIRQNEPGICPICGMDLVPLEVEQNSDIDPEALKMSPVAMQLADVSTVTVGKRNPVKPVRLNGKVQVDERLVYTQSSHIPGRLENLLVNFTGEYVKKGQVIANIYSPDLVTAQEEMFEAQKIMEIQPQLFKASVEKLKNWKLTDEQIEKILESGKIQEIFPVQADISGYVTKKLVNTGDYVSKGLALYEIADLSRVWILLDVYESDMVWIKKRDKVKFSVSSFPGEVYNGIISYLDPVIDPKTRVAKARIEYYNSGERLKPEMFVSGVVEAVLSGKDYPVVIPKTAVMWTGKRSVVYVREASEQGIAFKMREIDLGPAMEDSYIIEDGLHEGEEIAVSGTFSIDAAAQLALKPSMMNNGSGMNMSQHNNHSLGMSERPSHNQKEHKNMNETSELPLKEHYKTERFEVKGNCSMCKERIEKTALSVNGVVSAVWSQASKILELVYDQSKTSSDEVQQAIAEAGHDTPLFRAGDEVYESLPSCCKYER